MTSLEKAKEMLDDLTPTEVIVAYLFYEGKTLAEVGELMLKSKAWAHNQRKAIRLKWKS